MKSDVGKEDRINWHLVACVAATGVLAVLALSQFGKYVAELARVRYAVAAAMTHTDQDPNSSKGAVDAAKKTADALKKKNLFVKTPPREHPIKQVDGILGSEALIQNKWYREGDKVGDAKILSISATGIQVEWDGQKKTFSPIAANAPEAGPPRPPAVAKAEPNKPTKKPDANEVKVAAKPKADDPRAFIGMPLSEKVRGILLQIWSKMPDDQKKKAEEQWNQMSDEQKQQALQALENMPEEQVQQAIQSMANR